MKRRTTILTAILLSFALIAAGYIFFAGEDDWLAAVHYGIERQFPEVSHIDGDRLSDMDQTSIVLFDVREVSEFSVSHLANAIQVDPNMSTEDFVQEFSAISNGKTAIFYCSVGQRSSRLANRVQEALRSSGTEAVYNLEGGIFKWHNERRPLYNMGERPTRYVHSYGPAWGNMVEDQNNTRY